MTTPKSTFIIVPTYNEAANISAFLSALLADVQEVQVLVVDDNSPDGTADQVKKMLRTEPRLHLFQRTKKEGLGKAYVAGFQKAMAMGAQRLVQMDADFSHRIQDLLVLLAEPADCVFGSRWVKGGKIVNWSWFRVLLSRLGNMHAQMFLGLKLSDWTGGFNTWSADVLKCLELHKLEAQGYVFQIELKYKALRLQRSYKEVPITFEERRAGSSKMSWKIIFEAFWRVVMMGWKR